MAKSKTQTTTDAKPADAVGDSVDTGASAPGQFKRLRAISVPTFKMLEGGSYYFLFRSPIVTKQTTQKDEKGAMVEKEIRIASVVNLKTGEVGQIVVGTVLDSELANGFPKDSYVGKAFEIEKKKGKEGKRYRTYTIYEIDAPKEYKDK